jgi:predicted nucleotidyltransferase
MQDELKKLFGREVDFIEREGLKNPFRKRNILNNMKVIYESERS